jgi:arsenate reductase-like glutaredoxin family protein
MYETDTRFAEKWRTAMGFIDEDLDSGYPKVWAEMEALAWDRSELRERLRAVNDQWRSLLRDALTEAIDEYGLDEPRFSAEALAALVMQFQKGMLNERLLGIDRGHEELLSAIDGWLGSLSKEVR